MRVFMTLVVVASMLAVPVSASFAQDGIPPDVRAKMSGYVGTWSVEERVKDAPSAPESVINATWKARWFADSMIEWSGTATAEDGTTTTLVEYEGYDPIRQAYTYWFLSDGSRGHAYDGWWDGNTFRIQAVEYLADGSILRGRCTWPYNEDFTVVRDFTCERLTDGKWWVFRRGTSTKVSE